MAAGQLFFELFLNYFLTAKTTRGQSGEIKAESEKRGRNPFLFFPRNTRKKPRLEGWLNRQLAKDAKVAPGIAFCSSVTFLSGSPIYNNFTGHVRIICNTTPSSASLGLPPDDGDSDTALPAAGEDFLAARVTVL